MIYTCLKCQGETPFDYKCTLRKNERQEGKTGPSHDQWKKGGYKERVKEGEGGGCILYY
jgi:hypothetical protein